jgi:hypothetical protein
MAGPVACLPPTATSPAHHSAATTRRHGVMPTTAAPSAPRRRLLNGWHTSVDDGHSHAVTDAAFAEGMNQRRGEFTTVCGQVIRIAALVAPCGQACPHCAQALHTRDATSHPSAHARAPRRRLRWLWRRTGRHASLTAPEEPGA